jgi:hypothetical protein
MWFRLLGIGAIAVCLQAQNAPTDLFEKAPPEVDEALRARVSKFYQAHVDGKFRLAEQEIAEDSKDFFYNMEKTRYLGFEILKIKYEENFTKATVVVGVEIDWKNPRTGTIRVKPPVTSLWKIENGEWCWYIVESKDWKTPYGTMTPGPKGKTVLDTFKAPDSLAVTSGVRLAKNEIKLSAAEKSSGETSITNSLPGQVQLELGVPAVPGLTVTLDKKVLRKGETAKVMFLYEPNEKIPKGSMLAHVLVQPTNQDLGIRIFFLGAAQRSANQ